MIELKWLMNSSYDESFRRTRVRVRFLMGTIIGQNLPVGQTLEYQGPLPQGTGGLTPKKIYDYDLCRVKNPN